MSVIVTGTEVPRSCGGCEASGTGVCKLWMKSSEINGIGCNRHPDCPLKSTEGLIEQIESFAKKQEEIAFAVSDPNERYAHLQEENAYRHCLQVIKEYCEEGAVG